MRASPATLFLGRAFILSKLNLVSKLLNYRYINTERMSAMSALPPTLTRLIAKVTCLLLAAASLPTQAQETKLLPALVEKTEVTVGLGMAYAPRHLGAKEMRWIPFPTLSLYRGVFFLDTVRGVGAEYLTSNGLYASLAIAYDFGRSEKNSHWRPGSRKLRGMGEVKGATTANLLVAQELTSWLSINGEAEFRLAGHHRGNRYRLGLEATLLEKNNDAITLGVHVHAGDAQYNRTYFGVSDDQSKTSRFPRFAIQSGIYAYSVSADWYHDFDPHWTLSMGVNAMQFSNKARQSPIVERKTNVIGFAALHYAF